MKKVPKQYLIFLLPVLYLGWSLLINSSGGPFSLTRSDPEYPYLLNGLNCATLHFNNIGHTDHPGTPFQLLTGVFIRITHLFAGHGPIIEDVLSRPEKYLAASSLYLSLITFFLIWWVGRVVIRREEGMLGALILQSSLLLSNVVIDLPLRYNPDRVLVLYNLILAGLTVKYLFSENYPVRRYAVLSGILMGISFATKFNFLPVLLVPFLLVRDFRNKLVYGLVFLISFLAGILPIIRKFGEFRRFISGVASHDGLYGSGSQQVINWKSFIHNFLDLLYYNPAYTAILVLTGAVAVWYLVRRKDFHPDKRYLWFILSFILASAIGFLLVAKHFKVYYFAPVLSLSGLAFFILWKVAAGQWKGSPVNSVASGLLILLILISVLPLPGQYSRRVAQKELSMKTARFYTDHVTKNDLLFIEPTWMAGPMVENSLVYGISYIAARNEYFQNYRKLYPNVITWEGEGKNPGLFRTAEADPESILYGGRDIYVYSSDGRDAGQLIRYLETLAVRTGTSITLDTAYTNTSTSEKVFRIRNRDGWKTVESMGYIPDAATLSLASPVSGVFSISDMGSGDYLEVTLRIFGNDPEAKCRLIARSHQADRDGLYFEDSGSLQDIGKGWQLLRLRGTLAKAPADGQMECQVYYPGKGKVTIQDLTINHMGKR